MKKVMIALFAIILCIGLCACGGSTGINSGGGDEVSVTLPTIPEQIAVPTLPAMEETQSAETGEESESTEPIGETWPWDAEFREEDYKTYEIGLADQNGSTGSGIVWSKTGPFNPARELRMYNNGDIEDWYYGYPDYDFSSHECFYGADGSYREVHYLDNGYYDEKTNTSHGGSLLYMKEINPDGSYTEIEFNENGNSVHEAYADADGYYSERLYFEDGNLKKSICNDPAAGTYTEQECFENGMVKYSKNQSSEYTMEERYDEEGYCTYFYHKDANGEIECIADDTGKLVKFIQNGEVYEDPAFLAQTARSYSFRE